MYVFSWLPTPHHVRYNPSVSYRCQLNIRSLPTSINVHNYMAAVQSISLKGLNQFLLLIQDSNRPLGTQNCEFQMTSTKKQMCSRESIMPSNILITYSISHFKFKVNRQWCGDNSKLAVSTYQTCCRISQSHFDTHLQVYQLSNWMIFAKNKLVRVNLCSALTTRFYQYYFIAACFGHCTVNASLMAYWQHWLYSLTYPIACFAISDADFIDFNLQMHFSPDVFICTK